jgi:hypothetical protein
MARKGAAAPGLGPATVDWLMAGDPAIRWQALRDLLDAPERTWRAERAEVARRGWGGRLLDLQREDGHWGGGPYRPKWTCTTYTLQLLAWLGLPAGHPAARAACQAQLREGLETDGGINFWRPRRRVSEVCVTSMVLAQVCQLAGTGLPGVDGMVRYLLGEQMVDGGWNCLRGRGAVHSSFHTTTSALEGLLAYRAADGERARAAAAAAARGREFLLAHRLYRSHRTGAAVSPELTRLRFPPWWHHDVLRALDLFRACGAPRDPRLADAVAVVRARQGDDGRWTLASGWPGAVHFAMERPGAPSRWNTLRALRVLRWWDGGDGRQPRRSALPARARTAFWAGSTVG